MKRVICESDIIFIALIYNYLANGKNSITLSEARNYVEEVKKKISAIDYQSKLAICDEMREIGGMHFDRQKKCFVIDYNEHLMWWYDCQPNELVTASLSDDALRTIAVDRNDLQITKKYYFMRGTQNISCNNYTMAIEEARSKLKSRNCSNIEIVSAFPARLMKDGEYYVSYRCNVPHERAKIKKINAKI